MTLPSRAWGVPQRTAAKLAVSAALIAVVAHGIDLGAVRAHAASVDLSCALAAIFVLTAISIVHAQRWRVVLTALRQKLRYVLVLRLVLIGYFFNQVLPSTMGGDAFRIWGASRLGIPVETAASSVIIERALALASLLLMVIAGLPWLTELLPAMARGAVIVAIPAGAVLVIVAVLLCRRFATGLQRYRAGRFLLFAAAAARGVFLNMKALAGVLSLTVGGYVMLSSAVYLLGRGMSVDLHFFHALLLIPLVTLITVVPVSIGGWGVREGAMVLALGLIGVPAAAAFSLSVLYGLGMMATGAPGALIWWLGRGGLARRETGS